MRINQLFLGFLACFLLWGNASTTTAETELSGQDSILDEEEILFSDIPSVFSASKYEQKITDAPARISVITADEIQRYGHRTLLDILNTLPGFQLTYDSYYSYSGVRGFNVLGDYNSRILLLVDGHRINENVYSGAVLDHGMSLDVDLIDRVEVVRGPASSVYGSSAFFGVINVISKRGRDFQGTEVSVSAASQSSYKGRLSYGQRYENGLEVLMSASGYDSKGDDRIYYAEFDDPATNNGFAEDVDYSHNKNMYAKLSYDEYTMTLAYDESEKGIPTGSYGTLFNDPGTHTFEGRAYVDLKYQHLMNNGADLTARLFYDDYWYDGFWVYDYPPVTVFNDKAEGNWWGAEVQLSQQVLDDHYITIGLEYINSLREKQLQYDVFATYLDLNTDSTSFAAYIQDEFRISSDLILNLGVRYDSFSEVNSSTTPRLAVIWWPAEKTNLKLLYGEAFRAPSAYELYYDDQGLSQKAPATGLKPETIKTTELILEQVLSKNLNLVASIYHNTVDELIVLVTDPADSLLVFENKDEAKAKGGELELHGRWNNGVSGSLSYSNQHVEDGLGVTLVNSPREIIKFNIITPVREDDFSVGVEVQYESERKTLAGNETDAHIVTNLTLFNETWLKGMEVTASVYNLFDEQYAHPVSAEHLQDQIEQYGRTFRIKFDYLF